MDVGYGALAIALTVLSGLYTWWAFRTKGAGPGLRGLALTILVVAAYLTRTLQMLGRVVDAVVDWATALVFSPSVWIGIVLAGVAVLVFGGSRLADRRSDGAPAGGSARSGDAAPKQVPPAAGPNPAAGRGAPAIDDDLADIEAILRSRGIS